MNFFTRGTERFFATITICIKKSMNKSYFKESRRN